MTGHDDGADASSGDASELTATTGSMMLGNISGSFSIGNLFVNALDIEERVVPYDLFLTTSVIDQALTLRLNYCIDLFDRATANNMIDDLQAVLRAAVKDPEQLIGQILS